MLPLEVLPVPLLEELPLELLPELLDLLPELLLDELLEVTVEVPLELIPELPPEVVPLVLAAQQVLPLPPEVLAVLPPPFSGVELLHAARAKAAASGIRNRLDEIIGAPQRYCTLAEMLSAIERLRRPTWPDVNYFECSEC